MLVCVWRLGELHISVLMVYFEHVHIGLLDTLTKPLCTFMDIGQMPYLQGPFRHLAFALTEPHFVLMKIG